MRRLLTGGIFLFAIASAPMASAGNCSTYADCCTATTDCNYATQGCVCSSSCARDPKGCQCECIDGQVGGNGGQLPQQKKNPCSGTDCQFAPDGPATLYVDDVGTIGEVLRLLYCGADARTDCPIWFAPEANADVPAAPFTFRAEDGWTRDSIASQIAHEAWHDVEVFADHVVVTRQ